MGLVNGPPEPVSIGPDDDGNAELQFSCVSSSGESDPGVRLRWFLDQFPGQSTYASACALDFAPMMRELARLADNLLGGTCLADAVSLAADCALRRPGRGSRDGEASSTACHAK